MELNELNNKLKNYKKGTYIRVRYKKQLGNGYYAITEINTRLGCRYGKLGVNNGIVFSNRDYAKPIDNNKIVYKHIKNGTLYLQHEPQVGRSESRKYTVYKDGKRVDNNTAKALTKSLYVQKCAVKRIKLDNIVSIGKEV